MTKYIGPILGVIVGLLVSLGLQQAGLMPIVAKLIGVGVAIAVFVFYGRWRAAR